MKLKKIIATLTAGIVTVTGLAESVPAVFNDEMTWYQFSNSERNRLNQPDTTITVEYFGANDGWGDVGVLGMYNGEWVSYYFPCDLGENSMTFTVNELLDRMSDRYNEEREEGSVDRESDPKIHFSAEDINFEGVSAANGSSLISVSVARSAVDKLYSEYLFNEEEKSALTNSNAQLIIECDSSINANFFETAVLGKYGEYMLKTTLTSDSMDCKIYVDVDEIAFEMSQYYNSYINDSDYDVNITADDIQMIGISGLNNTLIRSANITIRNQIECYDPKVYIDNIEGYIDIAGNWGGDETVAAKDYVWSTDVWNGAALTCHDGTITSENASDYMMVIKAEMDSEPIIEWDYFYEMWMMIIGQKTWYFNKEKDCKMMTVLGPSSGIGTVNQMNVFDITLENGKSIYTYAFNAADINIASGSDWYSQLQMAYPGEIKLTIGYAHVSENDDYIYRNNEDGTITITKYKGKENNVVIPSKINEKKVTGIGADAFASCYSLETVKIPSGVTNIEERAFASCYSLKSVTIPDSVKSIGAWAFQYCTSLTSIVIPSSVRNIEAGALSGCGFTSIEIPDGVVNIGDWAFAACTDMISIMIPVSVEYIGEYAFFNNPSLTDINVDKNNKNLSSNDGVLFNKNQTELIKYPDGKKGGSYLIPDSVTSIWVDALSSTNLTAINVDSKNKVYSSQGGVLFNKEQTVLIKYPRGKTGDYTIPDGVEEIGYDSFGECMLLTSVEIPDSVVCIDEYAFNNCHSLTYIDIPNSVTSIPHNAFASCISLTSAVIPVNLNRITYTAFSNCPNLKVYGYTGSYAESCSKAYNIPFVPIDDSDKIQINKGVVVSVPENSNAVLQDQYLEVQKKKSDSNSITYSIAIKDKNGNKVQTNGNVTITIPVPANLEAQLCKVYRRESNGTYTVIDAEYEKGCMVFSTDRFGEYAVATQKPVSYTLGDVDNNGKTTTVDAKWVLQAVSGSRTLTPEQIAAADVNGDGKITTVDAKWILQAVSGSRTL